MRGQHARNVEAEHPVEAPERQPRAQAHGQLDHLGLGVAREHPVPELLVDAGLSPYEALAAATRQAGEFVGAAVGPEERFGRIAPGQRADLLLVEGDPLVDVAALTRMRGVMARGVWHAAEELGRRCGTIRIDERDEVRVVDDAGEPRGVREVGVLQVRGESVTPGYLTVDGPLPTQDADGWLDTGDEGYVVEDGQVVVCGRVKDVIIMGGRNIYPTDIERAASTVDGVRAGNVVAVRLDSDRASGRRREAFAVAVESKLAGDEAAERGIRNQVAARVVDAVGVRPLKVVVLPPGTLPKTPSGKLRRTATASMIT